MEYLIEGQYFTDESNIERVDRLYFFYLQHVSGNPKYELYGDSQIYAGMNLYERIFKDCFGNVNMFKQWINDNNKPISCEELILVIKVINKDVDKISMDINVTFDSILLKYSQVLFNLYPERVKQHVDTGLGGWKRHYRNKELKI